MRRTSMPTSIDLKASEADFQDLVVRYAQMKGWRVAHFSIGQTNKGYRTPVRYDGKGYPDVTAARNGQVIHFECKSAKGRVTAEQQAWIDALPDAYVIRPADWPQIQELLR